MGLDIKNTNVIIKANEILGRLLNLTLHYISPPLLKGWQESESSEKQHRQHSILLLHNSWATIWRPPLQWHWMYKSKPVGWGAGRWQDETTICNLVCHLFFQYYTSFQLRKQNGIKATRITLNELRTKKMTTLKDTATVYHDSSQHNCPGNSKGT